MIDDKEYPTEIKASIDIGSNSVILLIAEVKNNKILKILNEEISVTCLGKDIDKNHTFFEESMDNTLSTLDRYSSNISKYSIEKTNVIVTATEASRVADNANEFFEKIFKVTGLETNIISSYNEAFYTALGVSSFYKSSKGNNCVILDLGGASTEIIDIQLKPFLINNTISLPIGSVRAKSLFLNNTLQPTLDKIFTDFNIVDFKCEECIAVAGTMTTLALAHFNLTPVNINEINKMKIEYSKFYNFVNSLISISDKNLLEKFPFFSQRISMIREGAIVACKILEKLKCNTINISTYGLRHGTIVSIDKIKLQGLNK